MKLATAYVEVRPDLKGFKGELERETTSSVSEVGKKLGGLLAGGAFLTGAKRAIDAASDLNESVNVTNITFGKAEDKVASFAKTAAESIGQSERAARQATATFGGLLLNLGFTEDAAAETSIQLTKLASDLGSAFNTDPAEAALALSSALRGEQEPIMRYNVLLSDQAVRAKAVELGLSATTAAVDENGKVQARLALIMEQTSRVQGDFANTSEGAANAQRIAAAKAEDAAADMGDNLLPIYEQMVKIVGSVADVFGSLPEPVQTGVVALGGIVALTGPVKLAAEAISSLATIARTQLTKGLDSAATGAYSLAGNLKGATATLGAIGFAALAAEIAISDYADTQAEATRRTNLFKDALVESNGALNENVRAVASNELLTGELGASLRDAGANVARLTTGIFDQADGVVKLNNLYKDFVLSGVGDPLKKALEEAGLAGTAFGDELLRIAASGQFTEGEMVPLVDRLNDVAEGYSTGAREADNKAEADESAGVAAEGAAPKVENLADKLDLNEQAAKDAAESVDLFREAIERALEPLDYEEAVDRQAQSLSDLASDIDERAQAVKDARQRIADLQGMKAEDRPDDYAAQLKAAQADLQEALAETSLTLDGNTDAARRNREDLRGLVDVSVGVIEAAREQGRSLEDLQIIRQMEVDSLRTQLEQMGFNKEEIERYIDRIEEIPLTRATTLTVDQAKAEANLKIAMDRLQAYIDANPLSMDVAQAEKFAARRQREATGHAAGGSVMDGLFRVHDGELMRKQGANLEVIAGAPTALFDAVGEDQVLLLNEQNALLRRLIDAVAGGSIESQRAAALEMG